jgi:hypothetical protein
MFKKMNFYLLLIVFYEIELISTMSQNVKTEQAIIKNITANYSKDVRPSDQVVITTTIAFKQLEDLDEKKETFTFTIEPFFSWYDERLIWQPSSFNGISHVRIKSSLLWNPDIFLYNSVESKNGFLQNDVYGYVNSSGRILVDYPNQQIKVACNLDMTNYPFDKQNCSILLTSWNFYKGDVIQLDYDQANINDKEFIPDTIWDLEFKRPINSKMELNNRTVLKFEMVFSRKFKYFVFTVIIPLVLVQIMIFFTFRPTEKSKKGEHDDSTKES